MTTKTSLLLPYDALNHVVCCKLHIRHAALTGAIYTLNISILVVLLYSWRVQVNIKRYEDLQDVYYGVQIAYFAIIGTQLFMVFLSILLVIGILKEKKALIVPWVIGFIALMALEAVSVVYSNVLRDHVNKQFDALCKAEMAFFITRTILNMGQGCAHSCSLIGAVSLCGGYSLRFSRTAKKEILVLAIYAVIKFHNLLKAGITWKEAEAIEL